jgi:hypothetical protein
MSGQQNPLSSTSAVRRRFRVKMLWAFLLLSLLVVCVGIITPVVRSVARYWEFQRIRQQTTDKIRSLAARCPNDVPLSQWQQAVDWTANLISQEYFAPVASDPNSLKELCDALDDNTKEPVDLTTLQWVWEQCEKAPRDGAEYAIRFRSIRLLTKEPIKDDDLPHLWSLCKCRTVDLGNTQVTNIGLRHLADVTNLVGLCLEGTQVTDAGLEYLKASTHLTVMCLRKTKVTDAGLKHLGSLTNLKSLSLANTNVTDAGLTHLEGLTKLYTLCLKNTKVTSEGVARLQKALPNCDIGDYAVLVDWFGR